MNLTPHPPPPPPQFSLHAIREGAADILVQLLTSPLPEIRAAAIFGLACLIHSCPAAGDRPLHLHAGGGGGGGGAGAGGGGEGGEGGEHGGPVLSLTPSEDRLPAERLIAGAVTQVWARGIWRGFGRLHIPAQTKPNQAKLGEHTGFGGVLDGIGGRGNTGLSVRRGLCTAVYRIHAVLPTTKP